MPPVVAPLTGHLDAALTEFAKRFVQDGLIADQVAPTVSVGRQTDKYFIWGREAFQLTEKQLRASGAPAERIRISLSTDSYFSRSHALAAEIADEDRAGYADAGDLEQDSVQTLIAKIQLGREVELATMLGDTAQVTSNVTLAGGDQFSDYANSKPGVVVETAKSAIRKSGVRPNLMVAGEVVYTALVNHPAIRRFFSIGMPGATPTRALNEADLAAYFGVDRFLVGRAVQDSAAGVSSFVWGKNALVMYVSPSAGRRDISAVKNFRWQSAPGTAGGIGVVMARHPDPTAKSDIVGVDDYYHQKITAVETAYLIKDAAA
jgi:hypothetical protein